MVAEHTKSGGRVGVVGEGRDCSWAARGFLSPMESLKINFQNHASNTLSLPSSSHTAAELGLGEELPLISPIPVYTHRTFADFWADPSHGLPLQLPAPLPAPLANSFHV